MTGYRLTFATPDKTLPELGPALQALEPPDLLAQEFPHGLKTAVALADNPDSAELIEEHYGLAGEDAGNVALQGMRMRFSELLDENAQDETRQAELPYNKIGGDAVVFTFVRCAPLAKALKLLPKVSLARRVAPATELAGDQMTKVKTEAALGGHYPPVKALIASFRPAIGEGFTELPSPEQQKAILYGSYAAVFTVGEWVKAPAQPHH